MNINPVAYPGITDFSSMKDYGYDSLIDKAVAYFKLTREVLTGRSRKENIVGARQVVMWVLMEKMRFGCSEVGRLMDKDHATVLHARKKVNNLMDVEKGYKEYVYGFVNTL
tara:strand:- start:209 stop:541 length:333 start_codon:yes stop_codon:yes gene_type:complete